MAKTKRKEKKWYVVFVGKNPGVYSQWSSVQKQVHKFSGGRFKAYPSREIAEEKYQGYLRLQVDQAEKQLQGARQKLSSHVKGEPEKSLAKAKNRAVQITQVKRHKVPQSFDTSIFCHGAFSKDINASAVGLAVYTNTVLSQLWFGVFEAESNERRAELNAVSQALLIAEDEKKAGRTVKIHSQSTYAINSITQWSFGWSEKGWRKNDGEKIKHQDIIVPAFNTFKDLYGSVDVAYLLVENGNEGYELARRMSAMGIEAYDEGLNQMRSPLNIRELLELPNKHAG